MTNKGLGGAEPPWIEHEGGAVCPVPDGHDVEREYCDGVSRSKRPEFDANWLTVKRYRDCTAWEQQQVSAGIIPLTLPGESEAHADAYAQQASAEVPGFPRGALVEKISGPEWRGKVVGYYSSSFTPEGLVVECIAEGARGQVHVEPAKRMRLVTVAKGGE